MLFEPKTRVLFVCTENICRSPLAEGLMRHHLGLAGLSRSVTVASGGTIASQRGAKPDQRAQKVAAVSGINLNRIRASRVTEKELVRSNFVFAMDRSHLEVLFKLCPPDHHHKISLLLAHLPHSELEDVPDPYYGNFAGFIDVYNLIENAVIALIPHLDAGG